MDGLNRADIIQEFTKTDYDEGVYGMRTSSQAEKDVVIDIHVKQFDVTNPQHVAEYEDLMSKIYRPSSDLLLIQKETTFDRNGCYLIAVEWAEKTVLKPNP